MSDRMIRLLPWVAAAGLVVAVAALVAGSPEWRRMRTETGETRAAVEAAAAQTLAVHPSSTDEASARSTPVGRTAAELATADAQEIVDALPASGLPPEGRTLILAASAIMREGEHNDIFRHRIWPVHAPDGRVAGFLGVGYAASAALSGPSSAGWIAGVLLFVLGATAYWLSLPLWVWADARRRGERAPAWAAFVLVGNFVALAAYLLTRGEKGERGR
jgi:hypothetical protein